MTIQERRTGIILILIGLAVSFYAVSGLQMGTVNQPGPGFFPLISGAGIVILCTVWIVANRKCAPSSEPFWPQGEWKAPLLALVVMTIYAALMEELGYFFSTLIFLSAWQIFVEREKWLKTSIIAIVGTVVMYFIFAYLLGVALPEGMFGI
jgi:putative tricarboxylic transport membrane protein